jgi:hypothetical protein
MAIMHGVAGACFTLGWFVFADGAWFANRNTSTKYEFVECLPGIFCLLAMIMLMFVNHTAIQGPSDDGFGFGGGESAPEDVMRHKILFFISTLVFLAGLTVAIWMQAAKYKHSDNWWPGLALILQCVALMASSFCLGAAKMTKPPEDNMF